MTVAAKPFSGTKWQPPKPQTSDGADAWIFNNTLECVTIIYHDILMIYDKDDYEALICKLGPDQKDVASPRDIKLEELQRGCS